MQEEFYKKTTLAVLFNETLKQNPDKKEFLMELWTNIKSLQVDNPVIERACKDTCDTCPVKTQCKVLEELKNLVEKNHEVKVTDEYWNNLIKHGCRIIDNHKDSKLAKALVQSMFEDLSEYQKTLPEYKKWLEQLDD